MEKIANTKIINLINGFTNISRDTIKMIDKLCKENEIYIGIFKNLKDVIERGIETSTVAQIAKNIFDDIIDVQGKSFEFNNFRKFQTIAA